MTCYDMSRYSQCWLQEASAYRLEGVQQSPEWNTIRIPKGSCPMRFHTVPYGSIRIHTIPYGCAVPYLETVCKPHNPLDARLICVHDRDLGYECPKHRRVQEGPNMRWVHWNLEEEKGYSVK